MKIARFLICSLLCGAALVVAAVAADSPFWGDLVPGKYAAGFRVAVEYDFARAPLPAAAGESAPAKGREVQLAIWYPAGSAARGARPMELATLAEKLCGPAAEALALMERCWGDMRAVLGESIGNSRVQETLRGLSKHPTAAVLNAPPAPGRFPVVFFDSGMNGPASFYFALAEYLASHGYLAVSIPSRGLAPGKPLGFDIRGVETKVLDLAVAINTLSKAPGADAERIAVAAWSVGGASTALAQMRSAAVKAVVSLDGATGYKYGWDLLQQSHFFDLSRTIAPYLHFTGKLPNRFEVPKDFSYFTAVQTADSYLAEVESLNHAHFFAPGGVLPFAEKQMPHSEDFWASNRAVARLTLIFLDAFVKGDGAARRLIEALPSDVSARIALKKKPGPA